MKYVEASDHISVVMAGENGMGSAECGQKGESVGGQRARARTS